MSRALFTSWPASMTFGRVVLTSFGNGKVFHTSFLEKRRSDFKRPPTVRCQVMNMDEETIANANSSGSTAVELRLLLFVSGP